MSLSRVYKKSTLILSAVAVFALSGTSAAQASLSFLIASPTGQTSFNVTHADQSFALDLYALVQNSAGLASPTDGFTEANLGIGVTGSLVTAMGAEFGTGVAGSTFAYTPGWAATSSAAPWTSGGTVGIGGSENGVTESVVPNIYCAAVPPLAAMDTVLSSSFANGTGTSYSEFPIGSFTLTFTGAWSWGSASLELYKPNALDPANIWYEAGTVETGQGNSSNVLGLVAPVTFNETVPEPGSLALLLGGAMVFGIWKLLRRKA